MERKELGGGYYLERNPYSEGYDLYAPDGSGVGLEIDFKIECACIEKDGAEKFAAAMNAQAARIERLEKAAREVIARWETPLWKDAEPTAVVINELRKALKDT